MISTNETIQSTDHSSLASHTELVGAKIKLAKNSKISVQDNSCPIVDESSLNDHSSQNNTPSIIVSSGCGTASTPSTNSTLKAGDFSDDQLSQCIPNNDLVSIASKESINTPDPVFNTSYISPSSKSHKSPYNPLLSSGTTSKSSIKLSPGEKRSPRRPLSPSEAKILSMTKIPAFKSNSAYTSLPIADEDGSGKTKTSANLSGNLSRRQDSATFGENYDPFGTIPAQAGPQAKIDPTEITQRRGSAFTILLKEVASIPRRGSSNSIASHQISLSETSRVSSPFSRFRHSKSKSMFTNHGDTNASKNATCLDIEFGGAEKKKRGSKFSWFRNK